MFQNLAERRLVLKTTECVLEYVSEQAGKIVLIHLEHRIYIT